MSDGTHRHAEVWALLPWLANGRASAEQQALAEAHLRDCADCRAELAREQALVAAFATSPTPLPDAGPGLQRLMERLDREDDEPAFARPRPRRWAVGALAAIGVLELGLLGALGSGWRPQAEAPYRTLTRSESRPADGPRWRVVFDEHLTLQELQALLQRQRLTVEAGPSEAGVFTLAAIAPAPDADTLAATLRRLPQVRFAEAVPAAR